MTNCLIWKLSLLNEVYTTRPFKMEIRLVYIEGNVCKDTKNHELQC